MANVKENKKIRIATMITNATRSRTQSPLYSLVAPFYTKLDSPFHRRNLSSLMVNEDAKPVLAVQCSNV
jgi:hypothetical protein